MICSFRTLQRELAEYNRLMARNGGKPEGRVELFLALLRRATPGMKCRAIGVSWWP